MVVRSFIVLEEWEVEKGKMLRVRIAMKRKQLQKGEAESREASSPNHFLRSVLFSCM